jgi:ADP-heptose:LPS heptosyltransferase
VAVCDRRGNLRWHAIWENNPHIAMPTEDMSRAQVLVTGPGTRPYIAGRSDRQWVWRDYQCPAGEIYFSAAELGFGRRHAGQVIIEPNIKANASPNKDWGMLRWLALVALLRRKGVTPVQLGPAGTRVLPGADFVETANFRDACAVLANARGAVLPEGGLHHAAAAVGTPAVVIFGGYISPRQTGYPAQENIFTGGQPCGMRVPCRHCAEAMQEITPRAVCERLLAILRD